MILLKSIFAAFGFFTVLPVPQKWANDPRAFRFAPYWAPLVGLVIGWLNGMAFCLLRRLWRCYADISVGLEGCQSAVAYGLAAFVALLLPIALTRGLHFDGLADTCDGFFSCRDRARTLEIMKDSRIGTFGVLALVLVVLAQLLALLAFAFMHGTMFTYRGPAIILAPIVSRCLIVPTVVWTKSARPGGMGATFSDSDSWFARVYAVLSLALYLGLPFVWFHLAAAATLSGIMLAFFLGFLLLCRRRIGGWTGDTLGACSVLVETLVLDAAVFLT